MWGSTGSIGQQTLDVMSRHEDRFEINALTTHRNVTLVFQQARRFHPKCVVITGDVDREDWERKFKNIGVELLCEKEGLLKVASLGEVDLIVNALVGSVGLEATMRALEAGVSIALANKEVLVMAGELVMREAENRGLSIFPIDSEHSAIFQCLQGEDLRSVRRIILTASGGPFLYREKSELKQVTVDEALAHPNWSMGQKVTIDSATLMNKGLEVVEARWLFGIEPERVEVVVHPQSIVHSMVEFIDGSIKAQMGMPDMRIPISHALTYPERWTGDYGWMDFSKVIELEFLPPDTEKFPALQLAYTALEMGGTAPAVLNGADEVAVDLFLSGKIGFSHIPMVIEEALQRHEVVSRPGIEDIFRADCWARETVLNEITPNL